MTDTEYLIIMLAKLVDAIDRERNGLTGVKNFPTFEREIKEMRDSLFSHPAVQNTTQSVFIS